MHKSIAILLTLATSALCASVDHTGWFPFYIPWNDTSRNVTDASGSVETPAGARGFVQVGSDGHFQYQDGSRARFSGFVSVAQANFPDSADAPLIAAHLRRFGVNFMRVHLTDVDGVYGLFANSTNNTSDLDPVKLRKMDWFMKCLRDQGIYVNFCVQSGRIFKAGDGIPAPITQNQSKMSSLYDPRLIQLQKGLAASLANHVNPYTGLAYKNDPAVASWELTNENSLFQGWLSWAGASWDSLSASNPAGMDPYYTKELDTLWSRWLTTKYATDSAVSTAWSGTSASATNLVSNPSFETGTTGWNWWADPASSAEMTVNRRAGGYAGTYGLSVLMDAQGAKVYDANVNYSGMTVSQGTSYRLRFWTKGTEATTVAAEFLKEAVWTWYGSSTCTVDTTWTPCETYFTAPANIVDSLRFNIDFGFTKGTVRIDSVSFVPYGGNGLGSGESIASFSVNRSKRSTVGSLADSRAKDEARFYYDLEGRYIDALRSYLKDSLGVRVPVTFTNNWYGLASIASQARADYMDAHWYWQHPDFPNGWSATDYTIGNTPMVKDANGGTVAQFSWVRVAGKPFMASEYNHPFPNQYLCETPAFYFGYLGFLDADGALLHAYIDYSLHYKDTWNDQFFNVGTNPVLMTQLPLARLFRQGLVKPSVSQTTVDVTESDWSGSAKKFQDGWPLPGSANAFLSTPMRWGNFAATASTVTNFVSPGSRATSNTQELDWDRTNGILRTDNPWWQGAVGYLVGGSTTSRMSVSGIKTTAGRDFAAIHLVSADTLPIGTTRRMLLLTSARVENKSQVWNASFNALTRIYATGDTTVCEPVTGRVALRLGRTDSVSIWTLDSRGSRLAALPLVRSGDSIIVSLPGTTLWYEVALGDATSPITALRSHAATRARLAMRSSGRSWIATWSVPAGVGDLRAEFDLRDAAGRNLSHEEIPAQSTGTHRITPPAATGPTFARVRLKRTNTLIASEIFRLIPGL
ncbi:MAG: carbohydrate binding domain-containing protein [Fibrobacteres bacterium]|nr:carbohydrate binding domain-containing protein [Fibrobacterota bacterium]